MNQDLNNTAKHIGDAIIDMSEQLANKLDTWSNIVVGNEGSLPNTARAGYVNKTSADSGINLVVDLQAQEGMDAVLRTWAIDFGTNDTGLLLAENIQLTFAVEYTKARSLTERFDSVTRKNIHDLLHDNGTSLQAVVVSHESGYDKSADKTYGQRYDVSAAEIAEQGIADEICGLLHAVLESLQERAGAEAASLAA